MTNEVKVLSDDEVAEIAARATKASVGPWDWTYNVSGDVIALESSSLNKDVLVCTGNDSESWGDISEQDAEFIAHAREDIPALCATVRALRRDTERTYTPSIVEALRLLDDAGYGREVPNSLSDMIKKVLAERDDLLNRSHRTVIFECGCVFRQDGLDAEPQLVEHCTLWAEMERNAMIETIAESEKENTALREQLAQHEKRLVDVLENFRSKNIRRVDLITALWKAGLIVEEQP